RYGHGVRAVDRSALGQDVVGDAVGVHVAATAATAGLVVGQDRQARERRVGLDAHVVGTRRGRREGAALGVAALVGTAVVGAVGRRAAALDVQVGVAAAARDRHDQVAGPRRHGDGVVHRVAGRRMLARHRHALGERTTGAVATTATATVAADVDRGERGGDVGHAVAEVGSGFLDAAGRVVVIGVGAPVDAVGAGEGLERLGHVPPAGGRQQVEGLVVDAGGIV